MQVLKLFSSTPTAIAKKAIIMNRLDISRLQKDRPIFLKLGMIMSLAFAILAFNWTTSTYENEGIYFEEVQKHTKK